MNLNADGRVIAELVLEHRERVEGPAHTACADYEPSIPAVMAVVLAGLRKSTGLDTEDWGVRRAGTGSRKRRAIEFDEEEDE